MRTDPPATADIEWDAIRAIGAEALDFMEWVARLAAQPRGRGAGGAPVTVLLDPDAEARPGPRAIIARLDRESAGSAPDRSTTGAMGGDRVARIGAGPDPRLDGTWIDDSRRVVRSAWRGRIHDTPLPPEIAAHDESGRRLFAAAAFAVAVRSGRLGASVPGKPGTGTALVRPLVPPRNARPTGRKVSE